MTHLRHAIHLTHDIQAENRYFRVPFEVDPAAGPVEVRLSFDRDVAVIDLGCEGAAAWRGWSGGARDHFVIGAEDATPGYLPGELEPGEWAVILGLHVLPDAGIDATVEILQPARSIIDHGPIAPPVGDVPRGSSRALPAPAGLRWYAGDFHAHTLHSDGQESISGLAALGATAGLDFLAVTDHNTTSHHRHLPGVGAAFDIALLPGQEVTTHRGHANAFGDIGFIDFREPATRWVDEVEARGGIMSVNHPISTDCSWLYELDRAPRAIELWHVTWFLDLVATSPLAYFALWDRTATLLGGTDFHNRGQGAGPGTPTTWVLAEENTPEALLAGVDAGRTAIMGTVDTAGRLSVPELFTAPVLLRLGDELIAVDADGLVFADGQGRRRMVRGDRVTVVADPADGPFQLLRPDRRIVALCA